MPMPCRFLAITFTLCALLALSPASWAGVAPDSVHDAPPAKAPKAEKNKQRDAKSSDSKAGDAKAGKTKVDKDKKAKEKPTTYALPKDPKAVILTLDHQGGMMRRQSNDPVLVVHADGTVKVNAPWGMHKPVTAKVEADQLQSLLRTVLEKHSFEKIDMKALDKKIKEKGKMFAAADASSTIVTVDVPGHKHEAAIEALDTLAEQYPDVKMLQDFVAVERALNQFKGCIAAGGRDQLVKHMKAINDAVKKKYRDAKPFKVDDLTNVTAHKDDSLSIHFRRETKAEDGKIHILEANGYFPAKGDPRINASQAVTRPHNLRPGPPPQPLPPVRG